MRYIGIIGIMLICPYYFLLTTSKLEVADTFLPTNAGDSGGRGRRCSGR